MGSTPENPYTAPEHWTTALRSDLIAILGLTEWVEGFARRRDSLTVSLVDDVHEAEGEVRWIREEGVIRLGGDEPRAIPITIVQPRTLVEDPRPGPWVFYCHGHFSDPATGRAELVRGRPAMPGPWAVDLVRRGWSVVCADAPCFGDRRGEPEGAWFRRLLWDGRVPWGEMVTDQLVVLEWLCGQAEVRPTFVATVGMSMGGQMAQYVAALHSGVGAVVSIGALVDFDALEQADGLERHGLFWFVPGMRRRFRAADIPLLIAPRPHLALVGRRDPLCPHEGVLRIDDVVGESDAAGWRLSVHDCGHIETAAMRAEALAFLEGVVEGERR